MSAPGNVYSRKVFRAKASDSSGDLIYLPLALKNYLLNPSTNVTSEKKDDTGFKQKFHVDYVRHYDYVDASNNLIHCCSGFLLDPDTNSDYTSMLDDNPEILTNWFLHNLDGSGGTKNRMGKIRITDSSGYKYFILNDGGLNTMPYICLDTTQGDPLTPGIEFASIDGIRLFVKYKNAYYLPSTIYKIHLKVDDDASNGDRQRHPYMESVIPVSSNGKLPNAEGVVSVFIDFTSGHQEFRNDISVGDYLQIRLSAANEEGRYFFPDASIYNSGDVDASITVLLMDGMMDTGILQQIPDASTLGYNPSTIYNTYRVWLRPEFYERTYPQPYGDSEKPSTLADLFETQSSYTIPNPSAVPDVAPQLEGVQLINVNSSTGEPIPEGYYYGLPVALVDEDPDYNTVVYVDELGYVKRWWARPASAPGPTPPTPSITYATITNIEYRIDDPDDTTHMSYLRDNGNQGYRDAYIHPYIVVTTSDAGRVSLTMYADCSIGANDSLAYGDETFSMIASDEATVTVDFESAGSHIISVDQSPDSPSVLRWLLVTDINTCIQSSEESYIRLFVNVVTDATGSHDREEPASRTWFNNHVSAMIDEYTGLPANIISFWQLNK